MRPESETAAKGNLYRDCRRFIWEYTLTAFGRMNEFYTLDAFQNRREFGATAEL